MTVRRAIRPRDPGPSPVRAIGMRDATGYFFDALGQYREVGAQALGHGPQILWLFGGDDSGAEWLRNKFPSFDRDGSWTKGFNVRECNAWLVGECKRAGLFDPERMPIRGQGVWIAQGLLAVHLGDKVHFVRDGQTTEQKAGFADRGALWPAKPPIPPPASAADATIAQQVERMFSRWHWWHPAEYRVFTGLWAAGLLGAAINWRPHGLLVGPTGSGKSTLLELYCALSPLALKLDDYTAAGIRQHLTGRAAPLVLDEADEDPETMGRLQQVIALLRRASGGAGAQVVRGTGEGHSRSYNFMSPAVLGAVLAPPLLPQDANRITKLELVHIPPEANSLPAAEMMDWASAHAPELWGRAIDGIPRFRHNLNEVRCVLLRRGCSPRRADQLGTILAARAMMLEDEPLDTRAAEEDVASVEWLAQSREQAVEEGGPMRCLQHLLTSQADVLENGQRPTFERLIARALTQGDDDARRKLVDHGVKLTRFPARADGIPESLLVSRSHPALAKVFAGTQWGGNRWADDLKHLPGASVPPDSVSLRYGVKLRVVVVPLDCLSQGEMLPSLTSDRA